MAEALVFSSTFDALARALGSRLTAEAKTRFKALGVDFDARELLPAYPYETWVKVMDLGAELVMPNASPDARHEAMGRRLVDSYSETLMGKALLTAMRVIGPRRSLERMARNLRTGNNYTEAKLSVGSDGVHQLWCSRVASTSFYRGLLQRVVEVAGGNDVTVTPLGRDESGATFAITWT
jgi:uncharacterized protein (TIGR02265 family)